MRTTTIAMMSFFVLMFWQADMQANAAAVPDPLKPEYNAKTNPYLPIRSLEPIY
jgi:hypothetical protein